MIILSLYIFFKPTGLVTPFHLKIVKYQNIVIQHLTQDFRFIIQIYKPQVDQLCIVLKTNEKYKASLLKSVVFKLSNCGKISSIWVNEEQTYERIGKNF